MLLSSLWIWTTCLALMAAAQSTQGILDLVQRRLPDHVDDFEFQLLTNVKGNSTDPSNDNYIISSTINRKILIEGNSLSALASGFHRYLTDVVHVDIFWYIGSQLDTGPSTLPALNAPISGSSIVPWRYHFNTVTFSYTAAFWTWEDWELELDWLALRGVNLPLAWVGQEKILVDVFRELGMTDDEIISYFSGPAFQAWNRFGNIQGSWGRELPMEWIDNQFELQKNITKRMVELGMTPVLPCFTGFVPRAISRVLPNATVVNGSDWSGFPVGYTNVTFLEPVDPTFERLQKSFISKQAEALGNITHIYTLDQYNENNPYSGDLNYLRNVSYNTWQSLKAADSEAIWMMQGWLFFSLSSFWTNERIEAYLGGVENDSDMIVIDLFSETAPQWQRTDSYFGKPWLWCQLHNFGGNLGLYGQIMNVTINPVEALANSSSLIGFGLTMEGQEGNEIMYDLLLDQAWSESPIETATYFSNWVTRRYAGNGVVPSELHIAWEMMRSTVYNNTNSSVQAVTKSILELEPNITGMFRTGHHSTTITYPSNVLATAFNLMFNASKNNSDLWNNAAYQYDMVDVTRQVFSNSFDDMYRSLISAYTAFNTSNTTISALGKNITSLLATLDSVLLTNPAFSLSTWISAARAASTNTTLQSFYEYNARNQITLWGPDGEISDYASKSWGGLLSGYYVPRWQMFVDYLLEVPVIKYNYSELNERFLGLELNWQTQEINGTVQHGNQVASLQNILDGVGQWI
ncbi:glycoside hydrolase family 89 protein [Stipitochalara longipes BDJ]|nr:glycoside hydrolase family 89 protein [Stipitochalara longipes BDJ]